MQIRLDRSLPISLSEQIKGQIIYAISTGLLPVGSRLPSIRELATTLQVAPMTVSQVYKELAQLGAVATRPGAGTFVADISGADGATVTSASKDNLHQVIESAIHQAMMLGYTLDDVRQAFLDHVTQRSVAGANSRTLLMIGNFRPATEAYAQEIEAILSDLRVSVRPMLLDELRTSSPNLQEVLQTVALAITVPTRLHEVRALLEPRHCRVAAVAFRVNAEARRLLSAVLPTERVGIISTYPEFLQTIVDEVSLYCLTQTPPVSAVLGQDERIRQMLGQIDVLVYASGSEALLGRIPETVRAIELRHSPEPDSVRRLRPFIA